jgi:hypothetical protein
MAGTSTDQRGGGAATSGPATAPRSASKVESVGRPVGSVDVSIGPQFLQLFSEQLYSSPNKAFEELVANAWDAGASAVYIGMPEHLDQPQAAVWVLDNGESMDIGGIELLWSVANSTKPLRQNGRPQIGKFGIGKLSTFLLAHQLTYVCKAGDGVLRAVTMDYRRINEAGKNQLHIEAIPLTVRTLTEANLGELLADVPDRLLIQDIIRRGVPQSKTGDADEFGPGNGGTDYVAPSGTWTLVLMTELKKAGREMEMGRIRRMLRTALPLGGSISVDFRGEPLLPTKLDMAVTKRWTIGPDLELSSVEIVKASNQPPETYEIKASEVPYPHVEIEGVPGRITGAVTLFVDSISGGKSSRVAQSNGFFVNILGRVVNSADPYFGLANLNHSAWAKMRAAVRADGLNYAVSVDRESVSDEKSVEIFRAFLRTLFNMARNEHDAANTASWPKAGEVLTKKWGTVPLAPLRRVIGERTSEEANPPPYFLMPPGTEWPPSEPEEPGADLIEDVLLEGLGPDSWLVQYDPVARHVLVNTDHPFVREFAETHEQQILLRDSAFVELLTQAYMSDVGMSDDTIVQISEYRDQLLRLVARVRRRSAFQLAELLDSVTDDKDALERATSEALEYLGYVVEFISGSGEPEGIASAPVTPGERGSRRTYTFTFDAKSSKNGKVANGDVRVSSLVRHRSKYGADHVLVVAPDYEAGALYEECSTHKVTPIRARDLSALLLIQGTSGPIPFDVLHEMFDLTHPDSVHEWVEGLPARLNRLPRLSFDDLFAALVNIGYQEPDTLTISVIAREIRRENGRQDFPRDSDVEKVVNGLAVLIPDLIRATGHQVFLGAEPAVIRDVVTRLLRTVPERLRYTAQRSSGA